MVLGNIAERVCGQRRAVPRTSKQFLQLSNPNVEARVSKKPNV
jgi:hypothetical protein